MSKFKCRVERTVWMTAYVEVEAASPAEASLEACHVAQGDNVEWLTHNDTDDECAEDDCEEIENKG